MTQISNVLISLPDQITGFYGSSKFIFETCGMSGMFGPNLAKCISFYNVDWVKNDNYFSMPKRGIQKVRIPISAEFEFTAFGAGWLNYGAMVKANVKLEIGTEIYIGIGQRGKTIYDGCGGTFVGIRKDRKFGNRSVSIKKRNENIGKEGKSGFTDWYNGGNGFYGRIEGNWENTEEMPKSFEDGLNGGKTKDYDLEGGFGGGGNGPAGGGGGGYTGGHGGWSGCGGGGGGSFTQNGTMERGHKKPGKLKIKLLQRL